MERQHVVIIGAGRMGQGLALALSAAGADVALFSRRSRSLVPPLALHPGPRAGQVRAAELVLLATPDDVIPHAAAELADEGAVGRPQVVLHLSGLLDRRALRSLDATGAALGSFHPLQTIVEPSTAARRLAGCYAGIEGDARALAAGTRLAGDLRMHPVVLATDRKAGYHAGAVFAANYTVVLAGIAEHLAREAGVPPEIAGRLYLPLMRGAVSNLDLGPVAALTGPIRRGDLGTIRAHLAALPPADRQLYRGLGVAALRLARQAGLDAASARKVEQILTDQDDPETFSPGHP
ncbi:MAG TPA: Rossmann-like and DUF2520 domain-containing protein [Gemmatimonadales bacterium]|nr:Rossmann-like and DUF2520 domain-containing protein [Gemmatimonadales bacterium]